MGQETEERHDEVRNEKTKKKREGTEERSQNRPGEER